MPLQQVLRSDDRRVGHALTDAAPAFGGVARFLLRRRLEDAGAGRRDCARGRRGGRARRTRVARSVCTAIGVQFQFHSEFLDSPVFCRGSAALSRRCRRAGRRGGHGTAKRGHRSGVAQSRSWMAGDGRLFVLQRPRWLSSMRFPTERQFIPIGPQIVPRLIAVYRRSAAPSRPRRFLSVSAC